jgi:hypothetical protein
MNWNTDSGLTRAPKMQRPGLYGGPGATLSEASVLTLWSARGREHAQRVKKLLAQAHLLVCACSATAPQATPGDGVAGDYAIHLAQQALNADCDACAFEAIAGSNFVLTLMARFVRGRRRMVCVCVAF